MTTKFWLFLKCVRLDLLGPKLYFTVLLICSLSNLNCRISEHFLIVFVL